MSSAHEKWKIEGFSEKFSSKCGSFPLKVQNWKKNCFGKITKTLFCTRILPYDFFCPIFEKKCSSAEKKTWVTKKNTNVLFHILNALLKTLLKFFLPKPEDLSLLPQKKHVSLRKTCQNAICTRKMKNWDNSRRSFVQSLKVSCSKYHERNFFTRQKVISLFLCARILPFLDQCQVFLFQT